MRTEISKFSSDVTGWASGRSLRYDMSFKQVRTEFLIGAASLSTIRTEIGMRLPLSVRTNTVAISRPLLVLQRTTLILFHDELAEGVGD